MGISRKQAKKAPAQGDRLRRQLQASSLRRALAQHVPRPSWKLLGLAGVAGVAATGVVVARKRRAHVDLQPDELRDRLHERLEAAAADTASQPPDPAV